MCRGAIDHGLFACCVGFALGVSLAGAAGSGFGESDLFAGVALA